MLVVALLLALVFQLVLGQVFLQELGNKPDRALHREELWIVALPLLFEQSEDGVVDEGVEGVVEELAHWHLLVVLLVLDHRQQTLEQVLVGAAIFAVLDLLVLLVHFFDFLDVKLDFLFEERVVGLLCGVELHFYQVVVALQHRDEFLLRLLVPWELLRLRKLQLAQISVVVQGPRHLQKAAVCHNSKVQHLDVLVFVSCLDDAQQPVLLQTNFFEVKFFNGMVWVLDQGVAEVNARALAEVSVLGQVQLGDVLATGSSEHLL